MPHIHEKIDFCVEVLVVNNGKVLLRKHDKYGMWLSVGGHIELDEDPNQAAVREVKEEVGLDIELIGPRLFEQNEENRRELISPIGLNRHRINPAHEHVAFIYFGKSQTDNVIPEKPTDEWKWCEEGEIDALPGIPAEVAFYAKMALREVK
jgi:8-oxo-dGTP pyrophosphatase MutT (NUDIX family)